MSRISFGFANYKILPDFISKLLPYIPNTSNFNTNIFMKKIIINNYIFSILCVSSLTKLYILCYTLEIMVSDT